jgi:hypothetical protein
VKKFLPLAVKFFFSLSVKGSPAMTKPADDRNSKASTITVLSKAAELFFLVIT